MKLLLDTHVAIWWLSGDKRLSASTRQAIEDVPNAFLSAVSLWEILIKQDTGRLDLPTGFVDALLDDFLELRLTFEHAIEGRALPLLHRDPFDRMLVGQAKVEGLTIVTADPMLSEYGVPVLAA